MNSQTLNRRDFLRHTLAAGAGLLGAGLVGSHSASAQNINMTTSQSLQQLRRIYLATHPLNWISIINDPRRKTQPQRWEQFPGRCELAYQREIKLRERTYQLIRNAAEDEGMFVMPTGFQSNKEMTDLARQHFGDRCVICNYESELLGDDFDQGIKEDRKLAVKNRGPNIEGTEFSVWRSSKAWATDCVRQLEQHGYAYDPETVQFVAFGEDWHGCCANYPIHMVRALGAKKPVERRFDLINPDWSRMFLKCELVEQNIEMPENIRLFIFKTADEGPTWERYIAQFWEGSHGVMDLPHKVVVDFPDNSAREVNVQGRGVSMVRGINRDHWNHYGRLEMCVGCGSHTPYYATIAMAEDSLPLEDFRAALVAGQVLPIT